MASFSRSLNLNLIFLLKGKGIDEATKQVKKFGKQMDSLNTQILRAVGSFAAFKVGGALVKFGGAAIEEARDLERNLNGLATVFDELTPEMRRFSVNAVDMGLSMNEAAKASTFIGSVLKQSGFSISETADLTQRLVSLGADLAITYGYDIQEALLGMTALFRGEYDPIEKFGVAMKQSEINAELAARQLDHLTGAARRLAEQEIRVELLFQRSADALGAYGRQALTLFASQQRLRATFENVQAVVGFKLTPAFAELVNALIPLVEQLIPAGIAIFESLIPVVKGLTDNKDQLRTTVLQVAEAFIVIVKTMAFFAKLVIENISLVKNFILIAGGLLISVKIFTLMRTSIDLLNAAILKIPPSLALVSRALGALRIAIAASGIGLLLAVIGTVGAAILSTTDGLSQELINIQEEVDKFSLENATEEALGAAAGVEAINQALEDTGKGAGAASDAVGDFFRSMQDDANKLAARLQLEAFGASKGLIEKILGSGEDWYKVFAQVTREGVNSVRQVQQMFLQTAAGYDEAMQKWQEEFDAFQDFKKQALEARDATIEFVRAFKILPSIAEEIGTFEQSAVSQLESIEEKLKEAFDNKYILEQSYQNLLKYARDEFAALRQIERQRDQLLERRNAAQALINQVQTAVVSGANLVNLMRNLQDSAESVNVVEFATRMVSAGGELREFRTALITNFVEPIAAASSKSEKLVASYRSVVERTREFVENIKALRALGLDPMLFNQLIDAGVEAGGATAQALVEGGADTVNEVNSLFAELNALGAELGEDTAQVMYGQGENFVNGIIDGLDSQLGELESMAKTLAESFTDTFEDILVAGIEQAIAAAEAALSRMPQVPGFQYVPPPPPPGGTPVPLSPAGQAVASLRPPLTPTLGNVLFSSARQVRESTVSQLNQPYIYTDSRQQSTLQPTSPFRAVNPVSQFFLQTTNTVREFLNLSGQANSRVGAPAASTQRNSQTLRIG